MIGGSATLNVSPQAAPWRRLRAGLLCVLLLGASVSGQTVGDDTVTPTAEAPSAALGDSTAEGASDVLEASSGQDDASVAAALQFAPDGRPNPDFWMFDDDGHARDWLNKPPMDPADIKTRPAEYEAALADHGIHLDLTARELLVRGATIHDARSMGYPIEYLVVTELGRTYEALIIVKAQPSVIAACLKAMDAEPGGATVMRVKDPLPPEADIEAGLVSPWVVTPHHGPLVQITMEWLDDSGKRHAPSLESVLLDARTGETLEDLGWIFTGGTYGEYRQGRSTQSRFKADVEGDVVAIYLAGLDVCVFERNSMDGLTDGYYFPHPERMPGLGTPITLRFKLLDEVVVKGPAIDGPMAEPLEPRGEDLELDQEQDPELDPGR